jgi:cyclopropane-fatty-acyl-phospholipid synthase
VNTRLRQNLLFKCKLHRYIEAPEAGKYDRIVSIEMFEHMKNYDVLFERCTRWLKSGGQMFIHIFVHRTTPYHFEADSEDDWMSKYFFTGGTMVGLALFITLLLCVKTPNDG